MFSSSKCSWLLQAILTNATCAPECCSVPALSFCSPVHAHAASQPGPHHSFYPPEYHAAPPYAPVRGCTV